MAFIIVAYVLQSSCDDGRIVTHKAFAPKGVISKIKS